MLSLQRPRWAGFDHSYGSAPDIPTLLEQLRASPSSTTDAEPWPTPWSALVHQGDVSTASFAALPHVVAALPEALGAADESCFQLPAWVAICLTKNRVEIAAELRAAHFESLARLAGLVARAADRGWSSSCPACALAAIAAAKNQPGVAEAMMEMTSPDVAQAFLD